MIHYSGRVGKGYPVQEEYKPKPKPANADAWVDKKREKMERRKARREQVFAEMMSDPNSKHHGSSFSYAAKCPCKCGKCEEKRAWFYDRSRKPARKVEGSHYK